MSYNLEEITVVATVFIIIFILSIFFGVFWALLLVFSFLFVLYKFGRPNVRKKTTKTTVITTYKTEYQQEESIDGTLCSSKGIDVPFTGIPSPKIQSIRSPTPLLSAVTKRLSFNTSSFSPRSNGRTIYRRSFGSPSPLMQQQSPRNFSLINPKFQQQPTIKIAPPPADRLVPVQEEAKEPLKDPLSRSTILSALKQSTARKRSVYEDDDETDLNTEQTGNVSKRRRYTYPSTNDAPNRTVGSTAVDITQDIIKIDNNNTVKDRVLVEGEVDASTSPPDVHRMTGIGALIQTRLKRRPLHSSGDAEDIKEALPKRTKSLSDTLQRKELHKTSEMIEYAEKEKAQTSSEYNNNTDVFATSPSSISAIKSTFKNLSDGDSDSGCDADDDDDIVMKTAPVQEENLTRKRVIRNDSPVNHPKDKNSSSKRLSTNLTPSGGRRVSKKQMMSHTIEVTSSPARQTSDSSDSPASPGRNTTPKKRFSILRFPSKKSESKRRPVPVYCASVESPDLHKRQQASHKITRQDIELDRKLAWKKIQSFLDTSDDDGEAKDTDASDQQATSPSVALNVVTCLAASPPRTTCSTSSTTTQGLSLTSSTLTVSQTLSTPGTSAAPLTLASNPLGIQPLQVSATISNTTSSTAASTANNPNILSVPSAGGTPRKDTQAIGTSGISFGTPLMSSSSGAIANTALLTSVASSSQSLETPTLKAIQQNPVGLTTPSSLQTVNAVPVPSSDQIVPTNVPQGWSGNLNPGETKSLAANNPLISGLGNTSSTTKGGVDLTSAISNPLSGGLAAGTSSKQGPANTVNTFSSLVGFGSTNSPLAGSLAGASTISNQTQLALGTSKPAGSSLFSGLSGATASPSKPLAAPTVANTALSSASSSAFTFSAKPSEQPKPSSGFGASLQTEQKALAFGSATTATSVNFGVSTGIASVTPSLTQNNLHTPAKNTFGASLSGKEGIASGGFGQASSTQQVSNDSNPGFSFAASTASQPQTTKTNFSIFSSNNTAAPTNNPSPFGASVTQSPFGTSTSKSNFGASTTQKPFGASNTQTTFGAAGNQNAFGSAPNHNAFGAGTAQSAFGSGSTQSAFGSPAVTATQNAFGASSTTNAFGTPSKPAFGSNNSQSAFGKPGGGAFGASTNQNAFGTQTASAGGFNFTKPATSTNSGGFGFGSGASTSATPSSGGFNFGTSNSNANSGAFAFGGGSNTTSASSAGGFNFNAGASKASGGFNFSSSSGTTSTNSSGFNFGSSSAATPSGGFAFANNPSSAGFQFAAGQQNPAPATPAFGSSPAPSGGFNFSGGTAPAFGASAGATSTPGGFAFGANTQTPSSSVAKARPKATARRRARK